MRESRCLVHGILNFFFAVLLPYLMLLAMVLSALMTPCAGGPHRSSVFVTVLEYLLMLIPRAIWPRCPCWRSGPLRHCGAVAPGACCGPDWA